MLRNSVAERALTYPLTCDFAVVERHVAASLALAAGVPMKVVSEQLGHSSIQITSDIYSSVLPQVAQAAAEAAADLVPRRSTTTQTIGTSASSAIRRPTPADKPDTRESRCEGKPQLNEGGGRGSDPRPRDSESTSELVPPDDA
jgi:hypothetical protein